VILVDTSVWIDHLRTGVEDLANLLNRGLVFSHPFVIGELACGNLHDRANILGLLGDLPQVPVATDPEVLFFIERHELMGRGIGYIDAHLLAATSLDGTARLWTRDRRLQDMADSMGLAKRKR